MELKSSVLNSEIEALAKAPQYNVAHTWSAIVHLPNKDVKALYVHWVKNYANYTVNFSDEMILALALPAGDYDFDIYNNRDNLQITLIKEIVEQGSAVMIKSLAIENQTVRYRAKIVNPSSDTISQNLPGASDKKRLNDTQTRDVKFQLIHPIADYLKKMSSGGVFGPCRGIDAVRAFLGNMSRKAALEVGSNFKGVDIASGYDERISDIIMVPDHTPVPQIPKMINDDAGGIYSTGFWYYLVGEFWFVYPKLDLQRYFNHTGLRMRVINVPDRKLPESPKTFTIKDKLLTILATGDVKQMDLAEIEQENKGNGTRFSDPGKLFDDYVEKKDGKAIANAKEVITEVSIEARRDDTNYVTISDSPVTSRYNIEYSKLAARAGMLIQFVWESAAPELIYPGMPCSYVYLKNDLEVEELTGVVASVEWHSTTTQLDVHDRRFQRKAAVQIFVGRGINTFPVSHGNTGQGSSTLEEKEK